MRALLVVGTAVASRLWICSTLLKTDLLFTLPIQLDFLKHLVRLTATLKQGTEQQVAHATSLGGSRSGTASAATAAALAELRAALVQLEQQLHTLNTLGLEASQLCTALERAAAALEPWWALPEQLAKQQLEVAQVAATRSCAYLCCANVAAQGGPAAGQGVGSMRCR